MPLSNDRPHRRAHVACKACNARKVRCTVTLSGPPCANCAVDNVLCEIQSRKRRRNTDLLPEVPGSEAQDSPGPSQHGQPTPEVHTSQTESPQHGTVVVATDYEQPQWERPGELDGHTSPNQLPRAQNHSPDVASRETIPVGHEAAGYEAPPAPSAEVHQPEHIESFDTPTSSAIANDTSAWAETLEEGESHVDRVPFYPGDKRGPAFVIDICNPQRSTNSNHAFVAMPSMESLRPEEIEYLRFKGCFSLPPRELREALVRAYFHYNHPFEPVLDPEDFFNKYSKGHLSLLLLWSMFVSAASFIDDKLFAESFYDSQLGFKRTAYQRAKALYDADYEKNKLTLIQSVFLMGHFYANAEDRMGPWHWNGIAISLSHTIGLHMLTSPAHEGIQPSWRRLWWCIYYREVWLSLGQGRPMRISLDHCSTPMPGPYDTSPVCPPEYQYYLPEQLGTLLGMWLGLIRVTRVLGRILSTNYAIKGAKPSRNDIERDENEIRANWFPDGKYDQNSVLASHLYQFRLHVQAAIIALYRPFLRETPHGVLEDHVDSWQTLANNKVRAAASDATSAVNSMMAEDLIKYTQSVAILALGPPMQVHLLELTSSRQSSSQLARHNLALCMLALDGMRKSYISADAAYKLFDRARSMVEKTRQEAEAASRERTAVPETQGIETTRWLDDSEGYDFASTGIFSAFWTPFATFIPDDFSGASS
ncbi:hypothetical protein NW767_011444 [Fusarium falciforme]|uniref:Zn(2)-C6 fungal-type domain-containing protein n=1 Tax=Fusarium falciforme TaxID=195108 RepID=A0A9W8QVD7_9HYPO|nr:hypothetical protein NW755_013046 [Fusarium falciforme]KAJ4189946.1 hypothetical protein NW767_011444 [Fusarium falciforme]KAJ4240458.1 hypothetical protein NW757_012423 [Fusarium falciforme]